MKKVSFLFFVICFFLLSWLFKTPVQAQLNSKFKNEIVIYIQPGFLEFPDKEKGELFIEQVKIPSKTLFQAFNQNKIQTISKAFPDFTDSDTLRSVDNRTIVKIPQLSRIFRVTVSNQTNIDSAISILSKIPGIIYAEKNMDARLYYDPDYSKQWHLNNTGQSGGTIGADIKAEQAWSIFTGSSSVKIGVIDSGVKTDHEDLSGKSTGDLPDGDYHGTHVAGISAAKVNNNLGGRGVDWNAQIISRRIFDRGGYIGDANAANKIINAVDAGANILNNSWGGTQYSSTVRFAFAYAYKLNRVSVVAMGNDYNYGNPTKYPAAFGQGILAVGATSDVDSISSYSQTGNHIDVTAPGGINLYPNNDLHDIWATWGSSINSYRYLAGTSMATPVVTGIASLLKGYNSSLYNDDIEQIIKISADDMGDPGWDQYYGTGRVNAYKALQFLQSPYQLSQLFFLQDLPELQRNMHP